MFFKEIRKTTDWNAYTIAVNGKTSNNTQEMWTPVRRKLKKNSINVKDIKEVWIDGNTHGALAEEVSTL